MKRKTMKIGMVAFAILVATTLVGAAVISYYGEVKTTATVKQSIVFDGKEDNSAIEKTLDIVGGCCQCYKEKIKNRACIDGDVDFVTTYNPGLWGTEIITTIYQVPDTVTLQMNNKDTSWTEVYGDGIEGTLTFDPDSPTFDYTFNATGLALNTDYCLIYYADPWGGNHPGAWIATIQTDASGTIVPTTGSKNIGMNIPTSPDENYVAKTGGKIWLVLAADYDIINHVMIDWNPTAYLMEHNLIVYTDCDLSIDSWMASLLGTEVTGTMTIPADMDIDLILCYNFAMNIAPGTYTITTRATPSP